MKIFNSLLISFIIAGCIYVPTPEHGYSHMEEINKDKVKKLEPGTTTKDDVRLLFARPFQYLTARTGNTILCCYWKRKDGYFAVYGGEAVSTEVEHAFCLEFMPDDKLKRFKHFEDRWFNKDIWDQIKDWEFEEN